MACAGEESTTENENSGNQETDTTESVISEEEVEVTINKDSVIQAANELRTNIESSLADYQQKTIQTKELREQVKQKWSKIDFYAKDGKVTRIKTYPHEGISTRTEEFYFNTNGNLVIAVIEDKGLDKKGAQEGPKDKVYYYHNDKPVAEVKETSEAEYTIKDSDGERLLQEAKEYKELYSK